MNACCQALVAFALLSLSAAAQDLPDELRGSPFNLTKPATQFSVVETPSVAVQLYAWFEIDLESRQEKAVVLRYYIKHGGAEAVQYIDVHEVSFIPLDIIPAGPTADSMYVVGWVERSSKLVVEEWEVAQFAVGSMFNPVTGATTTTTASLPVVSKTQVGSFDTLPIEAGCYVENLSGHRVLLLLTHGTPKVIYSVRPDTAELSVFDDSVTTPALEGMRSMHAFTTETLESFVVLTKTPRDSDSNLYFFDKAFYYRDMDADGSFDVSELLGANEFYEQFPTSTWKE